MKQYSFVVRTLLACFMLVSVIMSAATIVPTSAYAAQGTVSTCTLTGNVTGVVMNDGHTCCPAAYSKDAETCIFGKYINPLIALLSYSVAFIVVIMVIYGAIEYITSGGDPQKAANGKKHITTALIALLVYILLYAALVFLIPGGIA